MGQARPTLLPGATPTVHRPDATARLLRRPVPTAFPGNVAPPTSPIRLASGVAFATLGGNGRRQAANADVSTDGVARVLRTTVLVTLDAPVVASRLLPVKAARRLHSLHSKCYFR